jgi:transposase
VVDETQRYSAAEMERMMKVQDVLLKAMARKITWWAAAEILGVTDRTMRRWREKLEKDGYAGLADRRKGKPSAQRIPLATIEKVLGLYKETYYDLNIRHFHEKLQDQHGIELSYTWVQKALQGAGLVAKRHKRGPHRRRRPRRPLPGMMLHIDGSKHRWLNDDRWYDLIVILDDATSEIYYAQLVEEESTRTVMAGLREVIEVQGLFCAVYSDRGSHFFVTVKAGEKVDKPPDAGWAGYEGTGSRDDRGIFTASTRPVGAQFWNLARAFAPGTATGGDYQHGGCQCLSAGKVHRGVQHQVQRAGGGERHGVSAYRPERPELDFHCTDGACGGKGQHGGNQGPVVADRQNTIPPQPGGQYRNDP